MSDIEKYADILSLPHHVSPYPASAAKGENCAARSAMDILRRVGETW